MQSVVRSSTIVLAVLAAVLAAALAAALAGGCGAPATPAPGASVPVVINPAATAAPPAPSTACPELPTSPVKELPGASRAVLTLLDAGAEPRRELRYHPVAGAHEPMTIRVDLDFDMAGLGRIVSPTTVMRAATDVVAVQADGVIVQRLILEQAEVEPRAGATPEMERAMAAELEGSTCDVATQRMDARGNVLGVRVVGDGMLADQLDQLDGLSTPLPAEAVGVGASWQVQETVTQKGITLDRVVTMDLVAIDGERVTLRGTIDVTAPPQSIDQDGVRTELTSMSGTATLDTVLELTSLVPRARQTSQIALEMSSGGSPVALTMAMTMTVAPE